MRTVQKCWRSNSNIEQKDEAKTHHDGCFQEKETLETKPPHNVSNHVEWNFSLTRV